eukprot:m.29017 g.29017  ORF g.29017 m.29017 type:complete len:572 (+) comp31124_c0_seq4:312-2027(+)
MTTSKSYRTSNSEQSQDLRNGVASLSSEGGLDEVHVTLPPNFKKGLNAAEFKDFAIGGKFKSRKSSDESGEFPYDELQQLRKENGLLREGARNDALAGELVEHSKTISKLRKERREMKQQLRQFRKENDQLPTKSLGGGSAQSEDSEKAALREQVERLGGQLKMMTEQYEREKMSERELPRRSLTGPVGVRTEVEAGRLEELQREVGILQEAKAELIKVNREWDTQYNNMKTQLTKRLEDSRLERDNVDAQMRQMAKVSDHQRAQEGTVTDLEARIRDLQRESREAKAEARGVRDELQDYKRVVEREKREGESEVKELQQANAEWTDYYDRLKRDSDMTIKDLRSAVESLNEQLNKALDNQFDMDKNAIGRLNQRITIKERELADESRLRREAEEHAERIRRDIEGMTGKWEHCSALLKAEQEANDQLRRQVRSGSDISHIEAWKAQIAEYGDDYHRVDDENRALKKRLGSLETSNGILQQQIAQYEEDFRREKQDKEDYLRRMREERERASRLEKRMSREGHPNSRGEDAQQFGIDTIEDQREQWRRIEEQQRAAHATGNAAPNTVYNVQ